MDKLRTDIVKTATDLFCKYGLKSVSIDDICTQLGISKKTFYLYFKQKSDLVYRVLEGVHSQKDDFILLVKENEADQTKNAIDRIMAIMDYTRTKKDKAHHTFFYDLTKYYPKIHAEFSSKKQQETVKYIKAEIERGIDEGIFRKEIDVDLMALFLTIQFQSIISTLKKGSKFQTVFDFMVDVYIRLVSNEKGLKYYNKHYLLVEHEK